MTSSQTIPLHIQLMFLPMKAVRLTIFDETSKENTPASGFITSENGVNYLYTAWHVVTGYDPNKIQLKNPPPKRTKIIVHSINSEEVNPGITRVGGRNEITIDLYDANGDSKKPKWIQDDQDVPNVDLNNIGLKIPFWHDSIKIRLPLSESLSKTVAISEEDFTNETTSLSFCTAIGPFRLRINGTTRLAA